ncbi:MAG: CHAT domain-containing protein [bacterium]|nr:CHAT domain-containing protein [bacterium]
MIVWVILLVLAIPVAAWPAGGGDMPPPSLGALPGRPLPGPAGLDSLFAGADRQLRSGALDSVLAAIRPVLAAAAATGDERLELRARLHEAGAEALGGRLREAERSARRAVALAEAAGAEAPGRMARRWLGFSLLGQGRSAEATAVYTALRDDARAAGDRREEAYALMGLAYQALGSGDASAARADYERSANLFAEVGEAAIVLDAQVGLARALGAEGRYDRMRRLYERILLDAEAQGNARVVGYVLNNLGSYEYQAGDPGLAVRYWERALDRKRGAADALALITPTVNLALARMALGGFDEAREGLEAMLARCREGGYREQEALVLGQLATLEQAHGRQAAARALWRRVLDLGVDAGQAGPEGAVDIVLSLLADGEAAAAGALADSLHAASSVAGDDYANARLQLAQARARRANGDPPAALAAASRARERFRAGGFRTDELLALVEMAACERDAALAAAARPERALALLQEARALWEAVRAVPRDPQWRERRGTLAAAIHLDLAGLLLEAPAGDAGRDSEAFDLLQGYKARTLLERRLGPDAFTPDAAHVPATLADVQRTALRPGELLLDYYLGVDRSWVFAVSIEGCRAYALPPARELRDRVSLFLDLLATPPPLDGAHGDHGVAARRLAADLLGPCSAELAGAAGVLIAADGFLNLVPFEMLPLPGDPDDGRPAVRVMARVPSAGVLLQVRKAAGGAGRGIALLGGGEAPAGDQLPGAVREARSLERHYRRVRRLEASGTTGSADRLAPAAGAAVLHVPAHSEAFDQRPWNSRIRVGHGPAGEPQWLTSAEIAASPLGVPLAVLSGCSSAGGQALTGEGMLGLSGAFLAGGTRAVVASLWDVDDEVVERLMAVFYRELATGAPVAAALATARRDLALRPATAAPRHWAAFVVVGDGALVVPVESRPAWPPLAAGGLALAAVLAAWLALRARRRDAGVIPGPDEALP